MLLVRFCCISSVSYIKPQLSDGSTGSLQVVYRPFPTSNHNLASAPSTVNWVVYRPFPTSNHNSETQCAVSRWLYIVRFLHQTTTALRFGENPFELYIVRFLHQTTTVVTAMLLTIGCISSVSYIKPQPYNYRLSHRPCCISSVSYIKPQPPIENFIIKKVVYRPFPTSNHNSDTLQLIRALLYIVRFLHQTTTLGTDADIRDRCISSVSYIKPQLREALFSISVRCISSVSYIKPQLKLEESTNTSGCISSVSYIKPQLRR